MTKKTLICACCKKLFVSGWTNNEALAEKEKNFPNISRNACGSVCTNCFVQIMLWAEKEHSHSKSWRVGYEELINEIGTLDND